MLAACWLAQRGSRIFFPFGHSPHVDLIADNGDEILRIQVKTSAYLRDGSRWEIVICTRGGNQSWNGIVKRWDPSRCDYLFVVVADGRQWFIPSTALAGETRLRLGGPKYAEYEVDRGPPIAADRPKISL